MSRCNLLVGNVIGSRYMIEKNLGKGEFADVYECSLSGKKYAVKVFRSGSHFKPYYDNEFKILSKLTSGEKHQHIVSFVESFCHLSYDLNEYVSYLHPCIVTELLGDDMLNFIRYLDAGLPISVAKSVSAQIISALDFIHKRGIIYADLKTQNVLLHKKIEDINDNNEIFVKLIDFNSSTTVDKLFSKSVGTQEYLSPELIVEAPYTSAADIWAFMCMVYELVTGDTLFDLDHTYGGSDTGSETGSDSDYGDDMEIDRNREREHLILIEGLLGCIPSNVVKDGRKFRQHFNNKGRLKDNPQIMRVNLLDNLKKEYDGILDTDCQELVDFVLYGLRCSPNDRPSAEQIMNHPWIKNINTPSGL